MRAIIHLIFIFDSVCHAVILRSTLWKCHPWVWSIFQLSHHAVSGREWFLQISQLVRRSGLVSTGKNYWWNHLSWFDVNFGSPISDIMADECNSGHTECLCISGTVLFIVDHVGHIRINEGDTCEYLFNIHIIFVETMTEFMFHFCLDYIINLGNC